MPGPANTDELVRYLINSLVEHPEDVVVEKSEGEAGVAYAVTVHPDDIGKVIGRGGRIIKSIRTLVRSAASLNDSDASVEVLG